MTSDVLHPRSSQLNTSFTTNAQKTRVLAGVFGFGLVGMSDDLYSLTDGWVIASIVLWIAWVGLIHAVLVPAERALAGGDNSAESKLNVANGLVALAAVVLIILMIFKPGA